MKRSLIAVVMILGSGVFGLPQAQAARFANQFCEFELPPRWQCNLEGAEWVCQSTDEARKREAIIVLAAKLKGDQDSLDQYLAYLKSPKVYVSVQGKSVKSDPKYAKNITLNGHPWVDSLHLESEIPGFYTRYLATVKQEIGVLVTYSINKDKYQQYLSEFDNMVASLKVFYKGGGINAKGPDGSVLNAAAIPNEISNTTVFPANPPGGDVKPPAQTSDDSTLWLILIVVGVVGYILWRKRQSSE